ncbi:MAG: FtsQ-type POTRA domain-containing protein [Deltaproteobacteria bacterium]|nr:FtsQ-type POTRA domain-containing protein [Candidatus Zymogenaceae bacterium]
MSRDYKHYTSREGNDRKGKSKKDSRSPSGSPTSGLFVMLLILLGVGFGVYKLSPVLSQRLSDADYFRISAVDVIGVERADKDEIARAVGVTVGESVLETDLLAMRERIEAVTWIKSVEVIRELPSKIVIRVEEHMPVGVIIDGNETRFVDPDGMTAVMNETVDAYPLFVDMKTAEEVIEAARLMEVLLRSGVTTLESVAMVSHDPMAGFEIVTRGGTRVRVGNAPFEEKIERLKMILPDATAQGTIEYIYLDMDDRIVVKNETL